MSTQLLAWTMRKHGDGAGLTMAKTGCVDV